MRFAGIVLAAGVLIGVLSGCGRREEIAPEIRSYEKPADATVRLEGQKFPYCLWYDPDKWLIIDTPFDPCDDVSEWTLLLVDLDKEISLGKDLEKKAFAKTYTFEEKNVSRASFKEFVQSKVLGGDKENLVMFKDLVSEERLVNNIKIFAWRFEVEYQKIGSITVFLYFYSDSDGSVAITTFTSSDKWKENKKDMEEFLNGFCLLQAS
ncbi:MAG: hypothetical protein JJU12_05760 [Chlamydiales bacterium]|nr:hypothetical protein [Chlamydiales bacterium]